MLTEVLRIRQMRLRKTRKDNCRDRIESVIILWEVRERQNHDTTRDSVQMTSECLSEIHDVYGIPIANGEV